jgi:hypothetical protein
MTLPPAFSDLHIVDIRDRLSVKPSTPAGCRRARVGAVSGATLHYNGPPVSAFGRPGAELRHVIEVDTPNHQQRLGADSLQYHLVVLSNGAIYQTRDLNYQAWHCGVFDGNEHHIAIHLPLGGAQDATTAQWASTIALFEAVLKVYRLPSRSAIKAHLEWKATACPGKPLMARLNAWRSGEVYTGGVYHIVDDVACANVREGPGRTFPIALDGKAVLYPGDTFDADAVVEGEAIGGDARWYHWRTGIGFVHASLLEGV